MKAMSKTGMVTAFRSGRGLCARGGGDLLAQDLFADLRRRAVRRLGEVDQMLVGGVCEVQMPFALQLAVEAVLGAQAIWSTEVSLKRTVGHVNRNVNDAASLLRRDARCSMNAGFFQDFRFWEVMLSALKAQGWLS